MSNKMHTFSKTLIAASLVACSAAANAEFSANMALTTDYVWRGVSQTNEDPAIQGGIDYSHESGVYLGVWGSNVEFGGPEHMEFDVYGGWAGEFGDLGVDVGVINYGYFDNPNDVDFTEGYLGASYKFFSAKVSHDFDNDNTYVEAGLDFSLPNDFGLALHVGNYDFDGGGDYTDYSVGVSKEIGGFGFDLSYYDTDLEDVDIADGRVVFTVSKSM
jgi:uncharacterized protein (TIGR02001 family)